MAKKTSTSYLLKIYKGSSISFSQREKYLDLYKKLQEKELAEKPKQVEQVEEKAEAPKAEPEPKEKVTEANIAIEHDFSKLKSDEDFIEFSKNLIIAFEKLMKKFNYENSGKKVFSNKIRECFVQAALDCEKQKIIGKKKTILCFARVNHYLRDKSEGTSGDQPEDADFEIAENQIKDLNLEYEFNSLSDLYIVVDQEDQRVY